MFAVNDSWSLSSQDQHFIHCCVPLEWWRSTLSIDTQYQLSSPQEMLEVKVLLIPGFLFGATHHLPNTN